MKTLVFLIVILTSLFQDLNAKACCSNGWIAYNSHCYFVGYEARTFSEAHHFCTQREAYLVRIDDYLENNFLKNMLKRSNVIRAWTGLTDQRAEGFWQWYGTNDHATFYDWGPGEPNNTDNEDCVAIRAMEAFDWNDYNCDRKFRLVCEK